ncbi:hypothetical protein OESDEN_10681 [Oesophagostomum dentatum]|uniref:Uncharacterized protein n=1 Tax=Oesophagostomum dentatum TaxID=61180 RepID=A0A0B1T146_OESDE|nr:hypothetical protein OESDEN_10681 [Oesophagostomum dentatum]
MTSLSTSYTAAIAANTNQARHERYAAHIPVNKGDSSGRQSTVSQDSQHSMFSNFKDFLQRREVTGQVVLRKDVALTIRDPTYF